MKTMTIRYGDSDSAQTLLSLERGQVASTKEAIGQAVECVRGTVWITFENGGADHVLEPGERITIRNGGRMVIEAMASSELKFLRQAQATKPEVSRPAVARGCSPECWRTFVTGVKLPLANFDSGF
jgi:Protein of unknown function (DUF2917)